MVDAIHRVGPYLRFVGQYGPVFIDPEDVRRVVTGKEGDALLFFCDGKHEFVKHSAHDVAAAIAADAASKAALQIMREPA